MAEHVLVQQVRLMTADGASHEQVAAAAATVDHALAAALACSDPDRARTLLPAAVRQLYVTLAPFIGAGLVNGSAWRDEQHARLFLHAQQVLGPEAAQIVPRPNTEPMPRPTGLPGQLFPRK